MSARASNPVTKGKASAFYVGAMCVLQILSSRAADDDDDDNDGNHGDRICSNRRRVKRCNASREVASNQWFVYY